MNQELPNDIQYLFERGIAGDNVGLLLRGIQKTDIERGMVIAKPGSITPHYIFAAEVYILTKREGGRHTPFFIGYRPQFYVRTTDVTGTIEQFIADDGSIPEMVMPGDRINMIVQLICPIAIEKGMRFAIREGGRTIGAGVVSEILDYIPTSYRFHEIVNKTPDSSLIYEDENLDEYFETEVYESDWEDEALKSSGLIEFQETHVNKPFEILIGINGNISKFRVNPILDDPSKFTRDFLYEILRELKKAWDSYQEKLAKKGTLLAGEQIEIEDKEKLGYDWVRLISTLSGYSYLQTDRKGDNKGIDAIIQGHKERPGKTTEIGNLNAQIKTVSKPEYDTNNKYLKYELKIDSYNKLKALPNCLLIIVVVPRYKVASANDIADICRAYWIPTSSWDETDNTSTKQIKIPVDQVFDVKPLQEIMERLYKGEKL